MQAIQLRESDYHRLIADENLDVLAELIRLNQTAHYHRTLDVIKLTRAINLDRIKKWISSEKE